MNARLKREQADHNLVAIYLSNGIKLVGTIDTFDDDAIHLSSTIEGGVTISRHNMSSVQKHLSKGNPDQRQR